MQNKIVKIALTSSLAMGLTAGLSGCIGSNAVTANVMKFNIEVVDNRYARAGVNLLLAPVYGITMAADYIVFNSIEF
jgi:fatty acid-binding protein DegV